MKETRWRAIYNDKTILPQYCKCGFKSGYENIDRDKLLAFDIYTIGNKEKYIPNDDKTGHLLFRMYLEPEQRLIYRRRVWGEVNLTTMEQKIKGYLYMVGWQQKVNGKNTQSINYIFPDGHVEQRGKWTSGEPRYIKEELQDVSRL